MQTVSTITAYKDALIYQVHVKALFDSMMEAGRMLGKIVLVP
ncbi:MAG: hypothetical protein ACXWCY_22950 [Burkholderiales bacterium]